MSVENRENIALEFVDAVKKFPSMKKNAVDGISLQIKQGEFITILGTSGSGKTTLMKMVNGLNDITDGNVIFFGIGIRDVDPVEHRRQIGYVVQQGGLFPHMSVEENIAVVPKILKWDSKRISDRVDELLSLVHLKPKTYRKRYPRELSGGQQQRVGIARAMAADPSVMLMDEPFGAIDAITRESLQDELKILQKKLKKTILFVTHDIHEAFKLGDKVIIMHEGKLQQFDTPNNIMMNPTNDFVSKLVSSDDILERIKIMTIEAVMVEHESQTNHEIILNKRTSIESSLPIFMKNKEAIIYVEDDEKNIIGQLSWNQLSEVSV